MKNINFTLYQPPSRQLRYWQYTFGVIIFITAGGLFVLSMMHLSNLKSLKAELANRQATVATHKQKNELLVKQKEELETLNKKVTKLDRRTQMPKTPLAVLTTITNAYENAATITSMNIRKNMIDINAQTNNTDAATAIIESLKKTPTTQRASLTSIQQGERDGNPVVTFMVKIPIDTKKKQVAVEEPKK